MEPVLVARCPAKVNLALRVLGRRADGYHEIDTVFQAIDLWDMLSARPGPGLSLHCDDPRVPTDGKNLVLRAAEAMLALGPATARGAEFQLRKAIPVEGGLGGGSADAAGALLLCARLWDLRVEPDRLAELGSRIGADVPFFLSGGTARGRGRGDRIERLPHGGRWTLVLGCPPFGVSTAEVYAGVAKRLTLPSNRVRLALPATHKWRKGNDFDVWTNDLEPVAFERWPELERFRDALVETGARKAMLCGSGSTVYGVFDEDAPAAVAVRSLRERFGGWRLLLTHSVDGRAHLIPT